LLIVCLLFNRCEREKESSSKAFLKRGLDRYYKGDLDQAIANFSKAIELNPQDATPYTNRGSVWFDKGEYDKAIDDYNKCLKLDPHNHVASVENHAEKVISNAIWLHAGYNKL
jgi:tetratricopeptide (TPR) repeat protein